MAPNILLGAGKHDDLVSNIAAGSLRIGIAFGDAIGSRDKAGISVDNGKLNGTTIFALDSTADYYLVATKDQQIYLVASDAASRKNLTTVDKTRTTCELVFDKSDAELISDDVDLFQNVLDLGRIIMAADTLGAGQNMIDQAVAYAKQREQFDRVIASFQAVKHMCAEMAAGLEPCRSTICLTYRD